jgi:hypothetical protein
MLYKAAYNGIVWCSDVHLNLTLLDRCVVRLVTGNYHNPRATLEVADMKVLLLWGSSPDCSLVMCTAPVLQT